ncbi:hypothetical protein GCM10023156_44480 [Novipirellula rosea]|uniref:Uncharacterized protein n=1 Tax=Novipirellula rosea TaxID=1031540 RepID=A0ABP8N8T8_9BACT
MGLKLHLDRLTQQPRLDQPQFFRVKVDAVAVNPTGKRGEDRGENGKTATKPGGESAANVLLGPIC